MVTSPGEDWFRFARDPHNGIEAVQAQFHSHAYDPHFHDQVLVGVTLQGLQQFRCRRETHRSTPGRVILMEPGEIHDGEAVMEDGFTYAMLYFETNWLRRAAALCAGRSDAAGVTAFPATLNDDAPLGRAVFEACRQVMLPDSRMARDAAIDAVVTHLARRSEGWQEMRRHAAPRIAARARDMIEAQYHDDLGLEALAAAAGTDRFRLSRAFKAAFGLAPHAYLVQRRLNRARQLLASGATPAAVAASTGFADQSHMGRWFRRAFGMTPAAYRRICSNIPDVAVT